MFFTCSIKVSTFRPLTSRLSPFRLSIFTKVGLQQEKSDSCSPNLMPLHCQIGPISTHYPKEMLSKMKKRLKNIKVCSQLRMKLLVCFFCISINMIISTRARYFHIGVGLDEPNIWGLFALKPQIFGTKIGPAIVNTISCLFVSCQESTKNRL